MASETDGVVLFGANGQVGHELLHALAPLGALTAFKSSEVDFRSPDSLRAAIRRLRPRIIVNAAAYTAVDKAETDEASAFAINSAAPALLAEEAHALDAVLVHYSTDYVFDGAKPAPYAEDDPINPLSVYGRSKAAGERAIATHRKHFIFRTSWVVGKHGNNFVKTMLRLASERDNLRVVADQIGAPTSAALLAETTADVLSAQRNGDAQRFGLYHLVAAGETSWYGLAHHVIARAGDMGLPLKIRPDAIQPITTAEYPSAAVRPANSRLDTAKLRQAFDIVLPDWTVGVNAVVDHVVATAPR